MGRNSYIGRALWATAILAVLSGAVLAGCGPERLIGPSITLRNDSANPIVVHIRQDKWAIGPDEKRRFYPSSASAGGDAKIELLDGESCAVLTTFTVSFKTDLDPVVAVPANGRPVQRVATDEERETYDTATASQNPCQSPADGWTVSVVNPADKTYYLLPTDEAGAAIQGYLQVLPKSTQTLRLYPPSNTTAGSIVLADTECRPLARVDHAAWGTYVMTIEAGKATIEKGPIPDDSAWLYSPQRPCPRTTASPK